jgi:hypothetical protein
MLFWSNGKKLEVPKEKNTSVNVQCALYTSHLFTEFKAVNGSVRRQIVGIKDLTRRALYRRSRLESIRGNTEEVKNAEVSWKPVTTRMLNETGNVL